MRAEASGVVACVAVMMLLAAPGTVMAGGCGVGAGATSFVDTFRRLSCLSLSLHIASDIDGGITISPAEQTWSMPEDVSFAMGSVGPTLEVRGSVGRKRETVTLWQRIYEPGRDLGIARGCAPVRAVRCPADRSMNGVVNGRTYPAGALTGFPYLRRGRARAAGWDTRKGDLVCYTTGAAGRLGGISSFFGMPVLEGGAASGLVGGEEYAASWLVTANHDGTPAPYVEFSVRDRVSGAACVSHTVSEAEIALPLASSFSGMTSFTLSFTPTPGAGEVWDFLAVSRTESQSHCTVMGPVYVTAQRGRYESPVLDSLSDRTAWQKLEWEVDQSSAAFDASCDCPTPGSPLTPVAVSCGASVTGSPLCTESVPVPHPDRGSYPIPASVRGRYFRMRADLFGREAASYVDASLRSGRPRGHFSGWRPVLKNLRVRYFARAAVAESVLIAPASLSRWGKVAYAVRTPAGATAAVDLLAADGSVLFENIPDGFDLGKSVDAYRHAAVKLRARLGCDPGEPGKRGAIVGWGVDWQESPDRIILNVKSFHPANGEVVRGLVAVELGGEVSVKVYDAATRKFVRDLFFDVTAAEALGVVWDGRDENGRLVRPGWYLVTATVPKGAGTRRVRVRR